MAGNGIVVWEWQNEFGCWRPYEPSISGFIENSKSSIYPIQLGIIDPRLYQYEIDLQRMCQVRQGTGTQRAIRRFVHPPSSPLAKGITWPWEGDIPGQWTDFDVNVMGTQRAIRRSVHPPSSPLAKGITWQWEGDIPGQWTDFDVNVMGTQRAIRRSVHPPSSPLAKGITWQWEGDIPGQWTDFDVDVMGCLEDGFTNGQTFIDLTSSRVGLPYHIDLKNMTQTRTHTGRKRKIQRVFTSASYPLDLSSGSSQNNKRNLQSIGQNKNVTAKKPRTVSSGVPPATSGTASNFGITFPSSSSSALQNGFSSLNFPSSSTSNSTSNASSVIQFGQPGHSQGPLTRSRYNHTLASNGLQGLGSTSQPSQTLPSASLNNNNNNYLPNLNSHGTGNSFSSLSLFANQPGFLHRLFGGQSQSSNHAGYNGLPPQPIVPGFGTNSFSSHHQPMSFPQAGSLNPSGVPGTRRVRPSASKGSHSLPPSQRIPNVEKSKKKTNSTGRLFGDIIDNYAVLLNTPPADEDCCICCEKLQEAAGHGEGGPDDHAVIQLEKCCHMFHKLCLKAMYDSGPKEGSLQCPTCKTIYGEKRGNCPIGEMEYHIIHNELAGYEGHKTIQITYHIPSGTQGPEHPHPGKRYSTRGFPRVGYIPDCDKGRLVVQLLIIAWKRRLTFTIGTSATTGEDNTVVWNEIHHKTEIGANYSGHGYPDPKYLDNVLLELAVHGITEKDLPT